MEKIGFHRWIKLQTVNSSECENRIKTIDPYVRDNAWLAAQIAYEEGVKEGKRQAGETIMDLIRK